MTPAEPQGWDNRTFRLGDERLVRLPSAAAYVPQIEKEHRWLPMLAPSLPLSIPEPVGMGAPGCGYPWPWSIYRWIDGSCASVAPVDDPSELAATLGTFLSALQRADASDGPPAGPHNFHRGGPLATYDGETRDAIETLRHRIDVAAVTAIWDAALASSWDGAPVWVHGDVAPNNLLVRDGRLAAVLDFGSAGVGDPACDLAIAWTFLDPGSRRAFRDALDLDPDTWARGRGWALWKALITIAARAGTDPSAIEGARRTLDAIRSDRGVRSW